MAPTELNWWGERRICPAASCAGHAGWVAASEQPASPTRSAPRRASVCFRTPFKSCLGLELAGVGPQDGGQRPLLVLVVACKGHAREAFELECACAHAPSRAGCAYRRSKAQGAGVWTRQQASRPQARASSGSRPAWPAGQLVSTNAAEARSGAHAQMKGGPGRSPGGVYRVAVSMTPSVRG